VTTAHIITLIVVIAACVGAIILLYFMGKRKRSIKKGDLLFRSPILVNLYYQLNHISSLLIFLKRILKMPFLK